MGLTHLLAAYIAIGLFSLPYADAVQAEEPQWQNQNGQRAVVYNGPVVNYGAGSPPPLPDSQPSYPASYLPPRIAPTPVYQPDPANDPHQRGLSLGGPRFGGTFVSGPGFEKLKDTVRKARPEVELEPYMSQFGWQVEYRMFRTSKGLTALTEFIPLVGGMDQGLALPSATWLMGVRTRKGIEFGAGPNFGLDGVAMMVGGGYTFDLGGINVPLNVAVGRGAFQTTSFSLSTGFNL